MATLDLDLDLTRDALASSTLSHGLALLGDRWIVAVILGAFLGVRRFEDWQARLGIPRDTLTDRLKTLIELGILRRRPYQEWPVRHAYHLTAKGLALYDHVLMMWVWERRWGSRGPQLPAQLVHRRCGHPFVPHLQCGACHQRIGLRDLGYTLEPNPDLAHRPAGRQRAARLSPAEAATMGLGLRVDRWALLIVSAILLGCHHFDQLSHVLRIGSGVLSRRLAGLVESDLLVCQTDLADARRRIYRLTPASVDLFPYILCFSQWASRHHFQLPSAIRTTHRACGTPFVPEVVCSHCRERLLPWDVGYDARATSSATSRRAG